MPPRATQHLAVFVGAIVHPPRRTSAFIKPVRFWLDVEAGNVTAALFIRCLRFLFAEFLEARIVPERIEHWIEPEQRGSERHV